MKFFSEISFAKPLLFKKIRFFWTKKLLLIFFLVHEILKNILEIFFFFCLSQDFKNGDFFFFKTVENKDIFRGFKLSVDQS